MLPRIFAGHDHCIIYPDTITFLGYDLELGIVSHGKADMDRGVIGRYLICPSILLL